LHVLLYTKAAQAGLLIIKDQGSRNKDKDQDQNQNQPPASVLLMTRFCSDNSSLTSTFLKTYLNIPTDHNKWDYTQSKKPHCSILEPSGPARIKNRQTCEHF
jgi:hypothetical protein